MTRCGITASVKLSLWILLGVGATSLSWGASQAHTYGLDASSAGRAGSVTAEASNPHAALYNPALLGTVTQSALTFSTLLTQVSVNPIGPVILPESQRNSDTPVSGTVSVPQLSQTRWALGLTLPITLKKLSRKVGFGFSASGPYEKLRSFNAYAPDDFYTARYGTADGQLKGTTSLGIELISNHLFFGAGLSLFLSGAGTAETTLSDTPTSRMNLDVVLQSAPVVGFYGKWDAFASALTYHQSIHPQLEQAMKARIQILKNTSIQQPLSMRGSLYYEPEMLEWEVQNRWNRLGVSAGLSYQLWNGYQAPILITETQDAAGARYQTQDSGVIARNTWNPRVSFNYEFSPKWSTSVGYQLRPTPFTDLSGPSNLLDSNTHILGASIRTQWVENGLFDGPLGLGVFGQLHHFERRTLPKPDASRAGYPEVQFSGNALLVGVSAEVPL